MEEISDYAENDIEADKNEDDPSSYKSGAAELLPYLGASEYAEYNRSGGHKENRDRVCCRFSHGDTVYRK